MQFEAEPSLQEGPVLTYLQAFDVCKDAAILRAENMEKIFFSHEALRIALIDVLKEASPIEIVDSRERARRLLGLLP